MTTLDETVQFIQMQATNDDLKAIIKAYEARSGYLAVLATQTYKPGDMVQFPGRSGLQIIGKVTGVNTKTVSVDANTFGKWRVHASFCKKVTG